MPAVSAIYPKAASGATQADHRQRMATASRARASVGSIKRVRASNPPVGADKPLDGARWRGIPYADTYRYFDTIKLLSLRPIPEDALTMLRAHCKHVDVRRHNEVMHPKRGKPYQINIHPWRFRIELHVPDQAALEYLAKRRGLKLTRADPAQDWTFDDEQAKLDLFNHLAEHFTQPHLKKHKRISFDNGGLSTGIKSKGRYFTFYSSKECRIDGVVDCLHIEGRYLGTEALAQIGLYKPKDLLNFDHAGYWSQIEAQQILMIDKERLGRHHANRQSGERRHHSEQTPFYGYRSHDRWLGSLLYRIHAIDDYGNISVQTFLRNYGRGAFVRNLASGNLLAIRRVIQSG
jgi:hypothetical protein